MLLESIKFRFLARPDLITSEEVERQASAGSNYQNGKDSMGHPIIYMRARRDPPGTTEDKLDLILYVMEMGIRSMDNERGVEKFVYIIDLKGFSVSQAGADPKLAQSWIHILQNYYPERLYKVIVVDSGMIFTGFWNIISYFVDPVTRKKMAFLTLAQLKKEVTNSDHLSPQTIEEYYGGTVPIKVSDDEYEIAILALQQLHKSKSQNHLGLKRADSIGTRAKSAKPTSMFGIKF